MRLPLIISSLLVLVSFPAYAGQSAKSLTTRFHRLDLNGDDVLDAGEFAKVFPVKLSSKSAIIQTRTSMFAWCDQDASGDIDLNEWLAAGVDLFKISRGKLGAKWLVKTGATPRLIESGDTGALSPAGPMELITTTGGECFGPATSFPDGFFSRD